VYFGTPPDEHVTFTAMAVRGAGDFHRNAITGNRVFVKPQWDISHSNSIIFMFNAQPRLSMSHYGGNSVRTAGPPHQRPHGVQLTAPTIRISDSPLQQHNAVLRRTVDDDKQADCSTLPIIPLLQVTKHFIVTPPGNATCFECR
jgi:hypothetical protein